MPLSVHFHSFVSLLSSLVLDREDVFFSSFSFNKSRPRCFDVAASHVGYVLLPGIANDGIAFGVVLAGCCNFFIHQEALVRVVPKIGQFLLFGPSIYMNGPRNVMKTDEANKVAADE